MIVTQIAVNVFLWLGVTLVLVSCLGVLVFRSVYDRLHFSAPLNLAAIFIAIAVLIQEDFSLVANKAIAIAMFLLVASPCSPTPRGGLPAWPTATTGGSVPTRRSRWIGSDGSARAGADATRRVGPDHGADR
jgi:multisubunit Na+/H+ antiporter MnhG subunit